MERKKRESPTRVIFRVYPAGDVIALLLDVEANPGHVVCFQHVGQHGEGRYFGIMGGTRPAMPEEYAPLKRELEAPPYGYTLLVRKRRTCQPGMRPGGRMQWRAQS